MAPVSTAFTSNTVQLPNRKTWTNNLKTKPGKMCVSFKLKEQNNTAQTHRGIISIFKLWPHFYSLHSHQQNKKLFFARVSKDAKLWSHSLENLALTWCTTCKLAILPIICKLCPLYIKILGHILVQCCTAILCFTKASAATSSNNLFSFKVNLSPQILQLYCNFFSLILTSKNYGNRSFWFRNHISISNYVFNFEKGKRKDISKYVLLCF